MDRPGVEPWPPWVKASVVLVVAVVVAVISTIGWLDSKYASKHDLALIRKDVSALDQIKQDVKAANEKLTQLRVLLAKLSR